MKKQIISAIIVCYNPNINKLYKNIRSVLKQVQQLVIIDNDSANFDCYSKEIITNSQIKIIRLSSNEGIAYALNTGIKSLMSSSDWVITLDQDSVAANDMLENLKKYIFQDNVAIICPQIVDINFSNHVKFSNLKCEEVKFAITSGCLTKISAIIEVGGFENKLFIDCVDHEICFRLRSYGYKILRANDAILYQEVGKITHHHFLGIKISTTNHAPFRRYFLYRNLIYIYKNYFLHEPIWCLCSFWTCIKVYLRILLFEKEKIKKTKCILLGIRNGILNRFDNFFIFRL